MENQNQSNNVAQQPLPNSTAILVLGIISIALCWCYGVIGVTLGIIALVLSGKSMSLYKINPSAYTVGSYNNAKAGKICAIIGLSLSGLVLIWIVVYFIFIGALITSMPWEMMMDYK